MSDDELFKVLRYEGKDSDLTPSLLYTLCEAFSARIQKTIQTHLVAGTLSVEILNTCLDEIRLVCETLSDADDTDVDVGEIDFDTISDVIEDQGGAIVRFIEAFPVQQAEHGSALHETESVSE